MRFSPAALICLIISCSQVQTPTKKLDETQISQTSRTKLDEARELIKEQKIKPAMAKLSELHDDKITPIEKALKYNLKGVALFNIDEIEKSILNFEVAEKYSPKDTQLYSQVQLNIASGYYKLEKFPEMKERFDKIDKKVLDEAELKKYAQLALAYGNQNQLAPLIVSSSVTLLGDAKNFTELQASNLFEPMKENFKKMSQKEKVAFLEEFNGSQHLAVAYLAQLEAEERYLNGDKEGAQDVITWLKDMFGSNDEVEKFVKDFETREDNSRKISLTDIGIVLPLTGEKASFGQKALMGVETGLKILGFPENVKIHPKDTVDSPVQAAQVIADLIKNQNVSFIIGGLFPESAKAEYLEARKYGVLYISLSQINLPKEEKNQNLIEVQGSIESQVETLLSDAMISKFGTRIGVIYPDTEGGKAYMEEVWRKSLQKNVQVTSLASFPKNTHDYRQAAQLFLGLRYPRERSEELAILNDVYAHEKTSIRRVQTLPPVMDFDWVFLATYPHEASQLIPTLGYYDANRLKVVGGPSWVSKSMVKEQKILGTLYFIGDDPKDINQEMLSKFQEINSKPAGLIELISLDAMKIGAEALKVSGGASRRDEFDSKIKNHANLKGLSTEWDFKEGVWLKRMNSMTITRGEIVKMFQ